MLVQNWSFINDNEYKYTFSFLLLLLKILD